ncbi:cyclase family protein [Rhodococcus opacus]|uniref:cyclase family protein n=1 Tax=Rhodococcus opacus TaxID=37919 RepID=UPI001C4579D7|nr:cyclase family protein [Rhodococcus opacus]MBV6760219.1 cyclase family protein [Rhodococcus opacus]
MTEVPHLTDLLADAPTNWGRWGTDDQVGALNFLTAPRVLEAVRAVRSGKVFTLGTPVGTGNDPVWPGRAQAQRYNTQDKSEYLVGKRTATAGGVEYADDFIAMYLQGTTHYDGLGHVWFDDTLYNSYPAETTTGGLTHNSVLPIAERGVVGRAVLLDMARHFGKDVLDKGQPFGLDDLLACAAAQQVEITKGSILLIRTGMIGSFFTRDSAEYYADYLEPGLEYSPELGRWFHEMEIASLATDTMANECTVHSSGAAFVLHAALMRNLGVAFAEILSLDELASDCAEDGQYDFLYAAAPLKVAEATGAPVNPLAIK